MTIQHHKFQLVSGLFEQCGKYRDTYRISIESIDDTYRIRLMKWCRALVLNNMAYWLILHR